MGNALTKVKSDPACLVVLNDREYRFVYEYIKDMNGARACVDVGYSPKGAGVQATKLLGKTKIKNAIKYLNNKIVKRTELTVEMVIEQLIFALTRKASMFCDENGVMLPPHLLPDEVSSIIDGFEVESVTYFDRELQEDVTKQKVKYKLTPHAAALEKGMTRLGLLIHQSQMDVTTKLTDWAAMHERDDTDPDIIETTIAEVSK